jgi:plastocyanin
MRKLIIGLSLLPALSVVAPATAATTRTVKIFRSGFSPPSVAITEGDTVVWVNRDSGNHQVLDDHGRFVSAILRRGEQYSFTFTAAATYRYRDELNPRLRGTIVVRGAPPSLTFATTVPIATYGDQVTLSGLVSNHREAEAVTIWYRPYPQPNMIARATLLSGPGGAFSFIAAPRILTTYQASWRGAYSLPTTVEVRPKITLGVHQGWRIRVRGGQSFAGRAVQFQRLNPVTGQWVTLRKPLLDATSRARVRYQLPKGLNRVRAAMSVNQAGAGYLGAFSPVVTWRVH